jgi:hypothetical protein
MIADQNFKCILIKQAGVAETADEWKTYPIKIWVGKLIEI